MLLRCSNSIHFWDLYVVGPLLANWRILLSAFFLSLGVLYEAKTSWKKNNVVLINELMLLSLYIFNS